MIGQGQKESPSVKVMGDSLGDNTQGLPAYGKYTPFFVSISIKQLKGGSYG
ncbi:hypothetical protein NCCP2716_30860 [Sporosarcina sp. NCCP-2716]|nr:hypothetical protein NCCP2716_30860 [Sporosarcina sp. NCCP-2716]